jgi:hypothetical protein
MIVHAYNPSYAGGISRRITVKGFMGGGGIMSSYLKNSLKQNGLEAWLK